MFIAPIYKLGLIIYETKDSANNYRFHRTVVYYEELQKFV
ncbi:hypothetical protein ABIB40_003805, partial [Pedobacter sp. UYP30]